MYWWSMPDIGSPAHMPNDLASHRFIKPKGIVQCESMQARNRTLILLDDEPS